MRRTLKNKDKQTFSLIAHSSPKSPITEQYRLIRSNIDFSSGDNKTKSIVVTSPEPSAGKTTTAINLAIVLAQQGKQVILVDADLRMPSIHYAFDVSNFHGLTSLLANKISLDGAITKTLVPNLDILTSGSIPQNPSELLGSSTMKTLIEELKSLYEYVVFDTPPVLAVTDPQIMANKCDGVVMVVASGKTSIAGAVKAKNLLEKAKGQLIGVVVNEVEAMNTVYHYQNH